MTPRDPSIQDYTVGWVCALPIELAAAVEMLDEEHPNLPQDDVDDNNYTLGRIGEHNVVIACLPAGHTGPNTAAVVAAQMRSKFVATRFVLMVGIGGGVPSAKSDIRLGDVVISQPQQQHGGVVQYDSGKTGPSGHLIRTGSLDSPPAFLLTALSKFRSNLLRQSSNFDEYLSKIVSRLSDFAYERAGSDILFKPDYVHIGGPTCDGCSKDQTVTRSPRRGNKTIVHYGTIASANQVMKDGVTRDRLCAELGGVLCFEMEAAGLMNNFRCLVIRGISDYADSHKNDLWQHYAAATAAACAKELLSVVPAARVTTPHSVGSAMETSAIPFQHLEQFRNSTFASSPHANDVIQTGEKEIKGKNVAQLHVPVPDNPYSGSRFGAQDHAWRSDVNLSSRTLDQRSLDIKRPSGEIPGRSGLGAIKPNWSSDENLVSSASTSGRPLSGIKGLFRKSHSTDKASEEKIKQSLKKDLKQRSSLCKWETDLDALAIAERIADIYKNQNKIDKALAWYCEVYEAREKILKINDPVMRATRISIGKCCEMKGLDKEASEWLK